MRVTLAITGPDSRGLYRDYDPVTGVVTGFARSMSGPWYSTPEQALSPSAGGSAASPAHSTPADSAGSMTTEPTSVPGDPYGVYGDSGWQVQQVSQQQAIGLIITLITIIARFGPTIGRLVLTGLARVGVWTTATTLRVSWNSVPRALRWILIAVGVTEGTDFVLDVANVPWAEGLYAGSLILPDPGEPGPAQPDNPGGIPWVSPANGGGGDLAGLVPSLPGYAVVGSWLANGTVFVKYSDGSRTRMAAQRRNGTWKMWTPKKPIVIYGSGASDLRALTRAEGAVDRQTKKLRKVVERGKTKTVYRCKTCRKPESSCICRS